MLHDVVTRYERGRYQLYVTRFSHARKSKSQAREMTIWIIKIMLSQKIGCSTWDSQNLNPDGFGNEGGDRQCIQKQSICVRTSTRSDYKLKSKI
jgi:hypothetical protein